MAGEADATAAAAAAAAATAATAAREWRLLRDNIPLVIIYIMILG
jgi:hypothetical protein